jgi:hypothetical protein
MTFAPHFIHFSADLETFRNKSILTIWSGFQFRENQQCEIGTVLMDLNAFVSLPSTIIARFGCNLVQTGRLERF